MAWNKLSTYKTRVLDFGDGMLSVQYHDTMIVKTYPERGRGVVELNTGGYDTVTTKRKMNQASHQFGLGFSVHQNRYRWYVTTKAGEYEFTADKFAFDAETGLPWDVVGLFLEQHKESA
jgi:hypothetical protein